MAQQFSLIGWHLLGIVHNRSGFGFWVLIHKQRNIVNTHCPGGMSYRHHSGLPAPPSRSFCRRVKNHVPHLILTSTLHLLPKSWDKELNLNCLWMIGLCPAAPWTFPWKGRNLRGYEGKGCIHWPSQSHWLGLLESSRFRMELLGSRGYFSQS